jgi:hypothetical protein
VYTLTLGNSVVAKFIYNFHLNDEDAQQGCESAPEGWKYLGDGCTRTAYLSPGGVVYKVGESHTNLQEARAARRLRNKKSLADQLVFIPKARNWRVGYECGSSQYVIAMEYINGKHTVCRASYTECNCRTFGAPYMCYSLLMDWLSEQGLHDMFSGNVLHTADNKFYIIDLGCEE